MQGNKDPGESGISLFFLIIKKLWHLHRTLNQALEENLPVCIRLDLHFESNTNII